MKTWFFIVTVFLFYDLSAQIDPVIQQLPTRQQLAWHETEFYLFVHFGPNTFTGKDWGEGTEPENIFNPTSLDCRQWCRIAKAAGAKGIIITAKHHDGFCLWPSKYSTHTVRESKWKDGKGDVLKELSRACKEYGLKFGVYISPWDRNHPDYGTEKYNDVFVNMMKEIIQNYGPVWEMWWDGANGEGTNARLTDSVGQEKKQVYDWKRFESTVRKISPQTVIFSDIGPDIRWVGNENGIAGKTNWNYLDTAGFTRGVGAPSSGILSQGNEKAINWIPAECDVSIRPGWFWRSNEDDKIKTGDQLFELYLKSVGRGANLLLNVPPDNRGFIADEDSAALISFKNIRDESFSNNLLKDGRTFYEFTPKDITFRSIEPSGAFGANLQNFTAEFSTSVNVNCIILREAIHLGQTVRKFRIEFFKEDKKTGEISGTTIGRKRILTFPSIKMTSFKVYLDDAKGSDNISGVAAYLIDEKLVEK